MWYASAPTNLQFHTNFLVDNYSSPLTIIIVHCAPSGLQKPNDYLPLSWPKHLQLTLNQVISSSLPLFYTIQLPIPPLLLPARFPASCPGTSAPAYPVPAPVIGSSMCPPAPAGRGSAPPRLNARARLPATHRRGRPRATSVWEL